jgi:rare lipoprotein A
MNVVVRINDRGPFIAGRIIDLSYGAAQVVHMVEAGIANIAIEILEPSEEAER